MCSKCQKIKKYIIDITFCVFILILGIILEFFFHYKIEFSQLPINIINDMIPLIFGIITISLTLSREELYGVSQLDFRRFRFDYKYSFKYMISIVLCIFAFTIPCLIFDCLILTIALDVVCYYFIIRFLIQELPLLTKDINKLDHIFAKNYLAIQKEISGKNFNETQDYVLLDNILLNLLLTRSLTDAYNILKCEDTNTNLNTLNKLGEVNRKLVKDIEIMVDNGEDIANIKSNGLVFSKIYVQCLKNLASLFQEYKTLFSIKDNHDQNSLINITSPFLNLYGISKKVKISETFLSNIEDELSSYFMFNKNELKISKYEVDLFNSLLKYSIQNRELWIIKLIFDSLPRGLSFLNGSYGTFCYISILLYFLIDENLLVPEDYKKQLKQLTITPLGGSNANGESISILIKNLRFLSPEKMINLLNLILVFDCNKSDFDQWFSPSHSYSIPNEQPIFNSQYLINKYIDFLCAFEQHNYYFTLKVNDSEIKALFEKNLGTNFNLFRSALSKYKTNIDKDILSFYNLETNADFNKEFIKRLQLLFNDDNVKKVLETIDNENTSVLYSLKNVEASVEDLRKKCKNNNLKSTKTCDLYSFIPFAVPKANIDDFIKNISLKISYYIDDGLYTYFYKNYKNVVNKEELNKLDYKKIISMYNVTNIKNYTLEEYDSSIKLCEYYKEEKIINDVPYFKGFWDSNSFLYDFSLDASNSKVIELSDDDVENIINKDYKEVDGTYKYYNKDNDCNLFIYKEDLVKIIKATFVKVVLKIDFTFIDDPDKLLVIK